jgi:hypothetical protein
MNELKQIRSMAEMIIEKVDALGATPFHQNGFREFVPEVNVWMPKFAIGDTVYYTPDGGTEEWTCTIKKIHSTYNSYEVVSHDGRHETWVAEKFLRSEPKTTEPKFAIGDCVGTTVGDRGRVTGIHKLDGHYRYRYLVLFDNGNHHHVAEPLLKLIEPKPKFAVGDRVTHGRGESCLGLGIVEETCFRDDIHFYTVRWVDQDGHVSHPSETYLRAYDDREWHSGPPPHVGWWNAGTGRHPDLWRWWDGARWSQHVHADHDAEIAGLLAMGATADTGILWTYYWPENARVARVDPGV